MKMTKDWVKKWGPVIVLTATIVEVQKALFEDRCRVPSQIHSIFHEQLGITTGRVMGLPLPSLSVGSMRPNMSCGKHSLMQQQRELALGMAKEAKVCDSASVL
jgi:hypothetical protein